MQKSNQWQWSVIFASVFAIVALMFAASFILSANEPATTITQEDPTTAETEEPADNPDEKPEEIVVSEDVKTGEYVKIITLVASLEIQEEVESDSYDRDRFRHWVNVEEKCSAREYVLREESTGKVGYSDEAECDVESGKWVSLYDNATLTSASDVDIDHMVPLKEAWESGAHSWNDGKRRSYANDIEEPRALIAVSAKSNRSKSDQDPKDWLPTADKYVCTYIADWVAVKYRWQLTVDKKERTTLVNYAEKCVETLVLVPKKA